MRHTKSEAALAISGVAISGISIWWLPVIFIFCILANTIFGDLSRQAGKIEVAKYIDPNVYLQKDVDLNGKYIWLLPAPAPQNRATR